MASKENSIQPNFLSLVRDRNFQEYEEDEVDKYMRQLEAEIKQLSTKQRDDAPNRLSEVKQQLQSVDDNLLALAAQGELQTATRDVLSASSFEARMLEEALLEKLNFLETHQQELYEDVRSIDADIDRLEMQLSRLSQLTSINEVFHIWFEGPYGTINNFRIGYLRANDDKMIAQTDAGMGQAALLVDFIANAAGVKFRQYSIQPVGSFAKIAKVKDRNSVFPLHIEQGPFTLYPRHNFNLALSGFMQCIHELGEYVAAYDPTMTMPHRIVLEESKIGGACFTFNDDLETWTRSMKFMLTDVKWIVAWFAKHSRDMTVTD